MLKVSDEVEAEAGSAGWGGRQACCWVKCFSAAGEFSEEEGAGGGGGGGRQEVVAEVGAVVEGGRCWGRFFGGGSRSVSICIFRGRSSSSLTMMMIATDVLANNKI